METDSLKEIKYKLTLADIQRVKDWCNENGHKLGRLKALCPRCNKEKFNKEIN